VEKSDRGNSSNNIATNYKPAGSKKGVPRLSVRLPLPQTLPSLCFLLALGQLWRSAAEVSLGELAMKIRRQRWAERWGRGCSEQGDERAVFKVLPFLKLVLFFAPSFASFLFGCVSGVFGIIIISARAAPAPPPPKAPRACCHW